ERRVAARAAAARHVVLLLGVPGQREERLEHAVGVVDQRLRDAVVADARETPLAVGGAEFVDEGPAILRAGRMDEAADVERGDLCGHARTLYLDSVPAGAPSARSRVPVAGPID